MSTTLSISTIIRDYTEVISGISRTLGENLKKDRLFKESFLFCGSVLKQIINYFFKCLGGFRDFSLFYIESGKYATDEEDICISKEDLTMEMSEILNLQENSLITGFLNSIFLVFPSSIIHIVAIRRLIIQGVPAAVYTLGGYLLGQLVFIFCIIFGIRSFIIPWLTLEPLTYFLGLVLLGRIIFSIRFESFLPLETWKHPTYKKYFLYSFFVALAEQGTVFPFLSNMTFSVNLSLLQGYYSKNSFIFFFKNFSYILGLFCGCIVFSGLGFLFLLQLKKIIFDRIVFFKDVFISRFNKICNILTVTLIIATLPYYSIHYLFLGFLGFMPEDRVFLNTLLSDNYNKDIAGELSSVTFPLTKIMELKLFPYNKGDYLIFPDEPQTYSMEDFIYRSDYAWVRRMEKLSNDLSTTHFRGAQLSRNIGFSRGERSVANRVLPRQTPLMTYRLDLHNKFTTENITILKDNLDFEYNNEGENTIKTEKTREKKRVTQKELNQLPHDPLLDRYFQWYDFENLDINTISEESGDDFETSTEAIDNLIYFFVRNLVESRFLFSSAFLQNQRDIGFGPYEIGLRTKQQYHQSLIFKSFIKTEVSLFLNREPKQWHLNGEHEYDLQAKQNFLMRHFDSFRSYINLPENFYKVFLDFFGGSINLSSQTYKQQFTGTLRNLTRFFNLTFDDDQSFKDNQVLNYLEDLDCDLTSRNETNDNLVESQDDISSQIQDLSSLLKDPAGFLNKNFDLDIDEDEDDEYDYSNIAVQETKYTKSDRNKKIDDDLSIEMVHKSISDEELSKLKRTNLVLSFDQALYRFSNFDIGPEPHEELANCIMNFPSIVENNVAFDDLLCTPFHYTWDHQLCNHLGYKLFASVAIDPTTFKNQFVHDFGFKHLDKRLKALRLFKNIKKDEFMKDRVDTFFKMNLSPIQLRLYGDPLGELTAFNCWPLPDAVLNNLKPPYKETLHYNLLMETKKQIDEKEEDELTLDIFDLIDDDEPLSFTRFWILEYLFEDGLRDSRGLLSLFVPQKGGFLWPGIDDVYIPGLKRRKLREALETMNDDQEISDNIDNLN